MLRLIPPLILTLALAACGGGDVRLALPRVEPAERIPSRFASIEVREVTLPLYASEEKIAFASENGAIETRPGLLWADDPVRAVTLVLTRGLGAVTGATVAAEPWPYYDPAEVLIDVRIEDMVVQPDGLLRLTGQAYIAPRDESRGRSQFFAVRVPTDPRGPGGIAVARAAAVSELAKGIAQTALR